MMRWRGRSRRTTCAMRAYLGEQGRGRNSDFLVERLANHSYSPGLRYWLCVTPGVWMLPAVQQQLLHGCAVSAQFVLSEIKQSRNLWLWCKNWVVKVLWTSCGSQSNRVTVNLEGDVCSLLKGEHVSDFNKVILLIPVTMPTAYKSILCLTDSQIPSVALPCRTLCSARGSTRWHLVLVLLWICFFLCSNLSAFINGNCLDVWVFLSSFWVNPFLF